MPYLKIQINRNLSDAACQTLAAKISRRLADELNKPERYVMVDLAPDAHLLFAGSQEPAAYIELKSIGLSDAQTQPLSQMICSLMQEELKISPERIYIEFTPILRKFWGWNSGTF